MRHGTRYAYVKRGCRCAECVEANRRANHARRQRRIERAKADPSRVPSHGELGYSDYGCRCDVCTRGKTEARRKQTGAAPAKTWTEEQIATALDVFAAQGPTAAALAVDASQTTVRRWAKACGVEYVRPIKHGTRNTYQRRGCRCDECTRVTMEDAARQKAKRYAAKASAPHGTASGYRNWGCRCDPCKRAGSVQNAEARLRRLARQSA